MSSSRNRIMAALTKGLTTYYPLKTQPATPRCAVLANGLLRILGTARCKPAMLPQERAKNELVGADNGEKYLLHN